MAVARAAAPVQKQAPRPPVKAALHVPADAYFFQCDNGDGFNYTGNTPALMPFYRHVIENTSLRVLVYNGDTDPGLNSFYAQNWTAALGYKAALGGAPLRIVEIGCGTGAGANLITREVYPDAQYLALDMQQAAINTCRARHATADNPGLTCQVVPNGVGGISPDGHQNRVPGVPDGSVDFVVISETHIADIMIGNLEKAIFSEIHRILKPGGLFLWGNALPTRVWEEAGAYLPAAGFDLVHSKNWTSAAILARDEDKERVDLALRQLMAPYYVMRVPYFGPRCYHVTERLIANFYRHPGTALYLKMVTGYDSDLRQAWRKR